VRLGPALGACAAALGCGSGAGTPPAPRPAAQAAAAAEASPAGGFRYRFHAPLAYDITRYDSLGFSRPGAGPPQISGKLAVLRVQPAGGHLDIFLDSLAPAPGSRLPTPALDSAVGARWQLPFSSKGPAGTMAANRRTIAVEQIGEIVRLLVPSLPGDGLKAEDAWSDSTSYSIQVDAFQALETAIRRSRAGPLPRAQGAAPLVTVEEQLTRTGSATQAGQGMTMTARGRRQVSYELSPDGWVRNLTGRDSLEIRVIVTATGQPIPVHWRTTFSARLRAPPSR
jgi:hypothetical protein